MDPDRCHKTAAIRPDPKQSKYIKTNSREALF